MKKKATSTKKSKPCVPWVGVPKDIKNYFGFVYLISNNATGKKYVGRKYLWKVVKKPVAGKKRRLRATVESDWRYYTGSCKDLNADIKLSGISNFTFEILHMCATRVQTNYMECKEQFNRDVLFSLSRDTKDYEYYNTNILSRYFRGTL